MIPNHVGIILDGNGRWAQERGMSRSEGHLAGAKNLDKLTDYIFKKGVKVLSLYVFSTENFKRSKEEVDYLMNLFVKMFKNNFKQYNKKGYKVVFSGGRDNLNQEVLNAIDEITIKTQNNKKGTINFCLNYGSHREIIDACKKICKDNINIDDLNEELFEEYLYHKLPNIDLLIRPGKEKRLSNFMLWQLSYAELYFTDVLFPDFDEVEFDKALEEFNRRNRRFGGVTNEKKTN